MTFRAVFFVACLAACSPAPRPEVPDGEEPQPAEGEGEGEGEGEEPAPDPGDKPDPVPDGDKVFCGGIGGKACPEKGQRCVDDPDDDCDPGKGGADCGGMCVPGEPAE
jgi:hypothetical protein